MPHVFAAGDITGRLMLVPEAIQDGFLAATNAVRGPTMPAGERVSPSGSFTDPEYAQVGLTEAKTRQTHDVVTAVVRFDSTTRTIIDGQKLGFCKLVVDRGTATILGCHIVGERAVDIVQVAAIALAAGMRVDDLARIPLAFPTYAGILVNAAASAARQLGLTVTWQGHHLDGDSPGGSTPGHGAVPGSADCACEFLRAVDTAYFSAFAALAGSLIGGLTAVSTTWVTQHVQLRAQRLHEDVGRRRELYRGFIEEASRLYADALEHDKAEVSKLVNLYAMVSRMRILSSLAVVEQADRVMRVVVDSYLAPNKTLRDVPEMWSRNHAMDLLRDFSNACREELEARVS